MWVVAKWTFLIRVRNSEVWKMIFLTISTTRYSVNDVTTFKMSKISKCECDLKNWTSIYVSMAHSKALKHVIALDRMLQLRVSRIYINLARWLFLSHFWLFKFWGIWGSCRNWLKLKIKPSSAVLAWKIWWNFNAL